MTGTQHALGRGAAAGTKVRPCRSAASTVVWLLLYALLAFGFYGARPLGEPDEGRYAEVAREMLADGDWLVPHLEGRPHLTKPPLTYWGAAAGMKLLGQNAWGARLVVAAAFFGTILCTAALARRWGLSTAQSRASGLVFGSALLPFTGGHILTTDMLLTFWVTLGVLAAWQVWRGPGTPRPWRWCFWLAFGLAFFTKGPPGLIPLLALGIFSALKSHRPPRARLGSAAGLVAMLVIALWWYLLLSARDYLATGSWGVLRHFTVGEMYGRFFTDEFKRSNSFMIYVYALSLGIAPWFFLWPGLIRRAWRTGWRGADDPWRFAILWLAVPYVIFTLSRSRMYLYVMPLFVPLAIGMGALLPAWIERMKAWPTVGRRLAGVCAGAWVIVLIGIAAWPEWAPKNRSQIGIARDLRKIGQPFNHLYTLDDPDLTLSFYTGLTIQEARIDNYNILLFLDYERRRGRPSAVAVEPKDLHKIVPNLSKAKILARNKDFVVVMPVEPFAHGSFVH